MDRVENNSFCKIATTLRHIEEGILWCLCKQEWKQLVTLKSCSVMQLLEPLPRLRLTSQCIAAPFSVGATVLQSNEENLDGRMDGRTARERENPQCASFLPQLHLETTTLVFQPWSSKLQKSNKKWIENFKVLF